MVSWRSKLGVLAAVSCGLFFGCGEQEPPGPPKPRLRQVHEVIDVSTRQSLLNSKTGVLRLRNTTKKPLGPLSVSFQNLESNQKGTINVTILEPDVTVEIGSLEGWSLEPKEAFQLNMVGYAESKYKTYRAENGGVGIW